MLLSSIHCYQVHNIFCCLIQNFNYTFFEFFSETLIAFYNVTQKCAFTNAKYQCAFRHWFQMPKKTPNYIVLMKYVNKLMHELFLRHTKSRNTIVKRWEWCWLQSWQGQVAFWSAWLGIFYNIMQCLPSTSMSHTLAIQSGPLCTICIREGPDWIARVWLAHACWWQALIL